MFKSILALTEHWPCDAGLLRDLWEYLRKKNNLDDGCCEVFKLGSAGKTAFQTFLAILSSFFKTCPGELAGFVVRVSINFPAAPRVVGASSAGSGTGRTHSSVCNLGAFGLVLAEAAMHEAIRWVLCCVMLHRQCRCCRKFTDFQIPG